MKRKLCTLVSMCALVPAFAQWSNSPSVNTPVCTATDKQIDLRMMDDGYKGVYIAWKDYRAGGVPDIYIQRMDSSGYALWTTNGVPLCTDPADQSTPAICTDMKGGAIVAWSDWRSGVERDLYAQRVNSNGSVLWTTDGVGVANKPEREHNEKITSDGAYGAYVVWEQQDNINYWWNIWLQRIDSSGAPYWTVGGQPVGTIANYRLNPKCQRDPVGGLYVCWQEWNGSDYDIYLQRFDKSGARLFGSNGTLICGAAGAQTDPKIDPDSASGGVIVAWVDKRNGTDYNIYSQRVDSTGNMLWTPNGKPVVAASGNQSAVDLLCNSKVGGTIYTWKDDRSLVNNGNDVYAQKLDMNGTPQWTANGVVLSNAQYDQVNPNITGDGAGGAIVVWQDSSSGQWDVRSQRIDKNGNILWAANGVDVSVASGNQTSPKNVSDGANGCIYAWQDSRNGVGTQDIYAHKIFWNGGNVGIAQNISHEKFTCSPNPFVNEVTVNYFLDRESKITLRVLDVLGKEILANELGLQQKGHHTYKLSESIEMLPGVYFIKLSGENISGTQRVVKAR